MKHLLKIPHASLARIVSGVLVCIFSTTLSTTIMAAATAPRVATVSSLGTAASESEPAGRLSAGEPLACLVFEAAMPKQLVLHEEQVAAWQHLERQHALLFGNRCADTSPQKPVLSVQIAEDTVSLSAYEKNLHDFVSGLSEAQRARLGEIARSYHESRAALEEKIIRHQLML